MPRVFAYGVQLSGEKKFVGMRKLKTSDEENFDNKSTAVVYDVCEEGETRAERLCLTTSSLLVKTWPCLFSFDLISFRSAPILASFPPPTHPTPSVPPISITSPTELTSDIPSFVIDFQLDTGAEAPRGLLPVEEGEEEDGGEMPRCEVKVRYDLVLGVGAAGGDQPQSSSLSLQLAYTPATASVLPRTPLALPTVDPTSAMLEINHVHYGTDRISHASMGRLWREWRVLRDWAGEAGKDVEEGAPGWERTKKDPGMGAADRVDAWLEGLRNEGGSGASVDEEFLVDDDEEDVVVEGMVEGQQGRKDLDFTERVWGFLLCELVSIMGFEAG